MARRHPRKEPQENTFFGGVAVLAVGIMVVKLIGMFYKIPLSNKIGQAGYADFTNAYNIYAVLLTISSAGLPVAVSKLISEARSQGNQLQIQRIFQVSMKLFLSMGCVSFVIMFFFADGLALMVGDLHAAPSIRALAPAVLFVSGIAAFRGYFQGHEEMSPTAISQIIEALCKLILGLSLADFVMQQEFTQELLVRLSPDLALEGLSPQEIASFQEAAQASYGAAAAIIGVTVGTALALAFLFGRYLLMGKRRSRNPGLNPESYHSILSSLLAIAIPITITSSMASIVTLLDAGLVQRQLQEALGMSLDESRRLYGNYSQAVNIYNLPLALISAVTISVIPAVSAATANRERKRAASIAISALRMTALLAMPMGVGLFVLGEPIIALLYQDADIQLAGQLLSCLGIVSIFVCLTLVSTSILQVYGFFHLPVVITLLGGVVKVITNYVLVGMPTIGIMGAPMGNFLCFALCLSLSLYILRRVVPGLQQSNALFYKPLLASAVMGGAAWVTYGLLSRFLLTISAFLEGEVLSRSGQALATLGTIGVAGVVYLALILLLGGISRSDILMMPKGEKLAKVLRLNH